MGHFLAWLESIGQDLRLAVRNLRKSPGFLSVVVLSLALGIGANSTIFSVVDTLLYRPLPYDHAEQLTTILDTRRDNPEYKENPPIAELLDWQKQNHVFQDIALTSGNEQGILSGAGQQPERITVQDVTPNFFALLGARPILGRISFPSEMQDQTQTIVISSSFWKTRFNNDPNILGKTIRLSGMVSTVVGVMPAGFAPFYGGTVDFWQPIDPESKRYSERADHWLLPVARLKPGVTLAQAQADMDTIARRLEQQYPASNKGIGKRVMPLRDALFGWSKRYLFPLFGAVAFVLLIACANVANLVQSRREAQRGEYAVRLSLGSGRARLVQQSLVESGVLALLGGLLGLLLARLGISLFLWLAGADFPGADAIHVDLRVVLFTLAVSLITVAISGLLPAVRASNPDLNSTLRDASRGTVTSRSRVRNLLAISEIALAMVLLVGTGLMISTMFHLRSLDPGFDASNVLTMTIQLPESDRYMHRVPGGDMEQATPQVSLFYQQLLDRISTLPGVESAGSITGLPGHFSEGYSFSIFGRPAPPPEQRPRAAQGQVSPGFFHTLKIPLREGRYLDDHDTATSPWAVVVNETFVRRFFPNEDPIGKLIRLRFDPYPTEESRPRQIVGVVADVRQYGLERNTPPFMYTSFLQGDAVYPGGSIVAQLWQDIAVRAAPGTNSANLVKAIREIVTQLDPDQPITNVMTMERLLMETLGDVRFYLQMLSIFAGVAVFLAGLGIYGVMSHFVSRRVHEIGVRLALGARPTNIFAWIGRLGLKLISVGIVIGVAFSLGLTRFLASAVPAVKANDPTTYAAVAAALIAIAFLACYLPARRATKVDPLVALRYE